MYTTSCDCAGKTLQTVDGSFEPILLGGMYETELLSSFIGSKMYIFGSLKSGGISQTMVSYSYCWPGEKAGAPEEDSTVSASRPGLPSLRLSDVTFSA